MSDTLPLASALRADIERWEADVRETSEQIEHLIARREVAQKRIDAAKTLVELMPEEPDQLEAQVEAPVRIGPTKKDVPAAAPVKRNRVVSSAWQDTIHAIVKKAEMGLTFAELRERLMASPIREKMEHSTKGYHNALSRLDRKKKIVRQYGRVFTPAAHRRFEQALQEGTVTADAPQPFAHSPMGEAILRLVGTRPGIVSREIIAELRKNPEFNAALTPHKTGAFNIIARLARRKQITRRDDGGLVTGPQFPQELLGRSPDGVGAPNGESASAPKADRDYPSLPFSQPSPLRH